MTLRRDDNKDSRNASNQPRNGGQHSAKMSGGGKQAVGTDQQSYTASSRIRVGTSQRQSLGDPSRATRTAPSQTSSKVSAVKTRNSRQDIKQTPSVNESVSTSSNHREDGGYEQEDGLVLSLPVCLEAPGRWQLLKETSLLPQVTTETLQELDLHWIQNNVNLRVDINYDGDLHFMPVSGRRRDEKQLGAHNYSRCLEIEFQVYHHDFAQTCATSEHHKPSQLTFRARLPSMFEELSKLLFILVPESEHDEVRHVLDVDLLMQQVRHGALDVERFSSWLCNLLTTHCAPVRDNWAQQVARTITEGAKEQGFTSLVAGLEQLFYFCEAMKLDVANHHIRTFRVPLIEDGVSFQKDYFSARLRNGRIDGRSSQDWFCVARQNFAKTSEDNTNGCNVLISGLISLCAYECSEIPETMKYDISRIRQLQEDFEDILYLRICLAVFDKCAHALVGKQITPGAMHALLMSRLLDLTDGQPDPENSARNVWHANFESIVVELTRALSALSRQVGGQISSVLHTVVDRQLSHAFDSEGTDHQATKVVEGDLCTQSISVATTFSNLSALRISDLQKQFQNDRQQIKSLRMIPSIEDMARRIAHMAIIHWRVWGDLIYCTDESISEVPGAERMSESSSDGSDEDDVTHDTLCDYDVI